MDSGLGFMVAGALVLLAVSGGFTWYAHVHRPEAINQFARERGLGLVFDSRDLGQLIGSWTGIGDASVRAENLLVMPIDGVVGENLLDHCCGGELVWGGPGSTSRWVFAIRPIPAAFPVVDIAPRTNVRPGRTAIEETHTLSCDDEGFLSELLDERMSAYLRHEIGSCRVSLIPGAIVVTTSTDWTGVLFEELIDFADGIGDRIRPGLFKQYPLPLVARARTITRTAPDWRLRPIPARVSQRADWPGGL